jgi:hypothetical protein
MLRAAYPSIALSPLWTQFKLMGESPKEAAMTRSKLSTKALLLAGGIGLSVGAFGGPQPAAAQTYSDEYACPAGTVYDPTYGCTGSGDAYAPYDYSYDYGYPYDYGDYGYLPYGGYGAYYGGHRDFSHGFAHGMAGGVNRGVGLAHGGGVGFAHGAAGGFGHGMGGGFGHGGGGGHR